MSKTYLPEWVCLISIFKATREREIYAQAFSYLEAAQYNQLQIVGRRAALLRWGLNVLHERTLILQKCAGSDQFPHSAFPNWMEFEQVTFRSWDHMSELQITAPHYQSAIYPLTQVCERAWIQRSRSMKPASVWTFPLCSAFFIFLSNCAGESGCWLLEVVERGMSIKERNDFRPEASYLQAPHPQELVATHSSSGKNIN